ncbi:MAG: hypothetical protein F4187_02650 [Gemmatimonadetes bacterium]|nr:hypothetical protein [Gemmatimonadota bacterium]MYI06895.1 hypothetical protein [Gemmatimonadota bacterium]
MDERYRRPITREDLLFTVEMALRKAERLWPKKRRPGDHDRLRPIALAIVDHIELCGMRVFRKPLVRGHSTPDTRGGPAKGGSRADDDG